MTDVLASLDDSGPLDFWQKVIAAAPELENSVNVVLSSFISIVIYNGTMQLNGSCWTGSVDVPKGISGAAVIQTPKFPPPLPPDGQLFITVKSNNWLQIDLCDVWWQTLFEAYDGPLPLPLLPEGAYTGYWKQLSPSK